MSVHDAHSCTLADLPSGRGLAFARCAPLALADTTRALSGALVIMSMRLFLMLSAMAGTAWGQKTAQETSEKNDMDGRCTYADFSQPDQVNCDGDDDDIPAPIDKARPLGRGSRVSTAAKNFGPTGPAWAQATFGDAYGEDAGNVRVFGTEGVRIPHGKLATVHGPDGARGD